MICQQTHKTQPFKKYFQSLVDQLHSNSNFSVPLIPNTPTQIIKFCKLSINNIFMQQEISHTGGDSGISELQATDYVNVNRYRRRELFRAKELS